jgi:hypothetical protein
VIDTGQVYHATLTVKDIDGNLVNASAITLTITLPDGSATTPPVTNPPAITGQYSADYTTTQAGLHKAAWVTTSPGSAATDYFNVRDFASVVSLAEAKAHLSAGSVASWTIDDDELRNFLAAVTEVIESKAGPCVRRTIVQRISGSAGCQLVLSQAPVISVATVQSVWTGGPGWTGSNLILDADAGIVTTQLGAIPFYYGPWDVTYTAGRTIVPERILHAAKELLRHLWESQRGQLAAPILGGGETFTTSTGWAFSIPNRVTELLADDMTPAI